MAEVLSPLRSAQAPIPGMTPIQRSSPPPTALEINTAFSPVSEDGTFMADRIIKQGWVMQRTRKTKNWKKRWFVLRGAVIGVYKDDSEYKMRHQILLSELTACAELKSPKKQNVFGVFSPSRNWHLQANNADDAKDWVTKVRQTARLEETEGEFLMSPTIRTGVLVPKPTKRSSPPNSPGGRGDCGLSSHTLDYSGASMSSTSELGGMISQISLNSPDQNAAPLASPGAAHHSAAHASGRRASAGPAGIGPTGGSSLPLQRSISADPEQGVVRHESNLSSFAGHMSDSKVIWHGYLLVLKSKSGLRQWKKLWVVLRPRSLTFYKTDEEYRALKLIQLENVIDAVEVDALSKSKRHCMQLILENKTYKFAAKDEEVLTKWLGAFKSTLTKSRR